MITKDFSGAEYGDVQDPTYLHRFVEKKEVEKLRMPHFYLRKHSFPFLIPCKLVSILFQAFIFLGIGIGTSSIVFMCEQFAVKYFV